MMLYYLRDCTDLHLVYCAQGTASQLSLHVDGSPTCHHFSALWTVWREIL